MGEFWCKLGAFGHKKCNKGLTDYCVPGYAVPAVKITLGTSLETIPGCTGDTDSNDGVICDQLCT